MYNDRIRGQLQGSEALSVPAVDVGPELHEHAHGPRRVGARGAVHWRAQLLIRAVRIRPAVQQESGHAGAAVANRKVQRLVILAILGVQLRPTNDKLLDQLLLRIPLRRPQQRGQVRRRPCRGRPCSTGGRRSPEAVLREEGGRRLRGVEAGAVILAHVYLSSGLQQVLYCIDVAVVHRQAQGRVAPGAQGVHGGLGLQQDLENQAVPTQHRLVEGRQPLEGGRGVEVGAAPHDQAHETHEALRGGNLKYRPASLVSRAVGVGLRHQQALRQV
mmetsp:Transcript_54992/g.158204  ORF Transcript_54992/g.158204 Transcript_54992/m.158204 type:complete len:273 (-) Transcript_54992:308-1126(-)